jgi:translation initiation factor 2 subunit 2
VVFKGKVSTAQVADRIRSYVDEYVLCSECSRPDTKIVKDDRILILVCETCGAHRPVHVKKQVKEEKAREIEAGQTYDMLIEDVGKKGDGIARKGNFIIFVPGTAKGSQVKVKIEKVSGTVAFGTRVQ